MRNPLVRNPATSVADEPKVEIAEDLLAESDAALLNAMTTRLPSRPTQNPMRPTPSRRPIRPLPEAAPDAAEDVLSSPAEDVDNSEKTHIRPMPTRRKPS